MENNMDLGETPPILKTNKKDTIEIVEHLTPGTPGILWEDVGGPATPDDTSKLFKPDRHSLQADSQDNIVKFDSAMKTKVAQALAIPESDVEFN